MFCTMHTLQIQDPAGGLNRSPKPELEGAVDTARGARALGSGLGDSPATGEEKPACTR